MARKNGSILITALWILTIFAFLAIALGIRAKLDIKMMGIQLEEADQRERLEAAIQIARYLIESDPHSDDDSPNDLWYGNHKLSDWIDADGFEFMIQDEESKININVASPSLLRTLFEILKAEGISLETNSQDLAASIVRWRGGSTPFGTPSTYRQKGQPFESMEEILLIEHITDHDFDTIKPFLTVYGRQGEKTLRINVNTASNEVLEALIKSLAGDGFTKNELINAFLSLREKQFENQETPFFKLRDLDANKLMSRLGVSSTVLMVSLVNQLLEFVSVDSSHFSVKVQKKDAKYRPSLVEVVMGPSGSRAVPFLPTQATVLGRGFFRTDNLDILSWRESA